MTCEDWWNIPWWWPLFIIGVSFGVTGAVFGIGILVMNMLGAKL